ncbi:MAG: peptidoglycan-binding protein [bacterium]|nr:peptidoglycan-binding protein [bacterium]
MISSKYSNRLLILVIFLTFLFLPKNNLLASSDLFYRDLKTGMMGHDVLELQKILNKDPDTRISEIGPGSPGNETDYFGTKTKNAVIKLQEKYSSTILLPSGLKSGTGYVGKWTKIMLETLNILPSELKFSTTTDTIKSEVKNILSKGIIPQEEAFQGIFSNDLSIFGISHVKIKSGDTLKISGQGFDSDTMINIGSDYTVKANITSDKSVYVLIPNISRGVYQIWASNSTSNTKNTSSIFLTIGDTTYERPRISSVTPTYANKNDTIIITADNLDTFGNSVFSSLGTIRNIFSKDGHTLSFKVSELPKSKAFFENTVVDRFTVSFSVKTKAGTSINYGYFIIIK